MSSSKDRISRLAARLMETGYEYGSGGKIHIKPENRGKFTALKKRTGHSASWFKAHGTPAQKKMAVFALNAKKWKHGDGGFLNEYGDGGFPRYNGYNEDAKTDSGERYYDIVRDRYNAAMGALRRKGFGYEDASRLVPMIVVQNNLEGGWRMSRKDNNYGGMRKNGRMLSFDTVDDFYDAYLDMLDEKWSGWRKAKDLDDWARILNHEDLNLWSKELFDEYNRNHRDAPVYLYAPEWENNYKKYREHLRGVENRTFGYLGMVMDNEPYYNWEMEMDNPFYGGGEGGGGRACGGRIRTNKFAMGGDENGGPWWKTLISTPTKVPNMTGTATGAAVGLRDIPLTDSTVGKELGVAGASLWPLAPWLGSQAALGINTMGRMAMPSTFLKGVASYAPKVAGTVAAVSPWLDAGALSLWSAQAGKSAINAAKEGRTGDAIGYGVMSALPIAMPLGMRGYQNGKNFVDSFKLSPYDIDLSAIGEDMDRAAHLSRGEYALNRLNRFYALSGRAGQVRGYDPAVPRQMYNMSDAYRSARSGVYGQFADAARDAGVPLADYLGNQEVADIIHGPVRRATGRLQHSLRGIRQADNWERMHRQYDNLGTVQNLRSQVQAALHPELNTPLAGVEQPSFRWGEINPNTGEIAGRAAPPTLSEYLRSSTQPVIAPDLQPVSTVGMTQADYDSALAEYLSSYENTLREAEASGNSSERVYANRALENARQRFGSRHYRLDDGTFVPYTTDESYPYEDLPIDVLQDMTDRFWSTDANHGLNLGDERRIDAGAVRDRLQLAMRNIARRPYERYLGDLSEISDANLVDEINYLRNSSGDYDYFHMNSGISSWDEGAAPTEYSLRGRLANELFNRYTRDGRTLATAPDNVIDALNNERMNQYFADATGSIEAIANEYGLRQARSRPWLRTPGGYSAAPQTPEEIEAERVRLQRAHQRDVNLARRMGDSSAYIDEMKKNATTHVGGATSMGNIYNARFSGTFSPEGVELGQALNEYIANSGANYVGQIPDFTKVESVDDVAKIAKFLRENDLISPNVDMPYDITHMLWSSGDTGAVGTTAMNMLENVPSGFSLSISSLSGDSVPIALKGALSNYGTGPGQFTIVPTGSMHGLNGMQVNAIEGINPDGTIKFTQPGMIRRWTNFDPRQALFTPEEVAEIMNATSDAGIRPELIDRYQSAVDAIDNVSLGRINSAIEEINRKNELLGLPKLEYARSTRAYKPSPGDTYRSRSDLKRPGFREIKHELGGMMDRINSVYKNDKGAISAAIANARKKQKK